MGVGWRLAMQTALYGRDGFFVRQHDGPADHFRTSVHASPLFAGALARVAERVDAALGHPRTFDLVDVGAGRGELITALLASLPDRLAGRINPVAVEVAPRPPGLDPAVRWRPDVPAEITGLLVATEWLDNVPLDIVETDEHGRLRKVLVDRATGTETLGADADPADRFWTSRWWPGPGRIEVGWPRDRAWADAVGSIRRGAALCVDYGHVKADRPVLGTMTGFRQGRQVVPVPDGGCDVTAHVAMDAVAAAAGAPHRMVRQRAALRALGVDGSRPPLDLARTDPAGYLRALSAAGAAAELTDPNGLGSHWWLCHTIGLGDRGTMLW
ncbi:SAM-dependent methyltransferase [Actinoplanes sichuanensis]|uniref:SAM-dependent methyltransferase n=1 Tax=Actinoplanes sichuanensis TaxID=512349 RepID=A0ABW4AMP4_9ACTN|nr:SAM-dependent methyltransferase [Actinoplanes sichuanensis]BEL10995.1 SAM-dependent methyltransferase [Actinoplanes sichuanensis]